MGKYKKKLESTDNSSVYRKSFIKLYSSCPLCSPNKGCNSKWSNDINCWKTHRKQQWR